ncbi:MAG: diadenylate cyclase CdaA [Desulfobacteraceae bacterium]
MNFFPIITDLRLQDALDILFLTVFSYHLFLWFRGTKAFKALVGMLVFGVVFTAARFWGLFLTTWVFQILWQVVVLLLIILFQREIRQVLERVNPLRTLGLHRFAATEEWIRSISRAVFSLGVRRIGALIVLERSDSVEELVTEGHSLEADPTPEIIASVFQKESPLHDGAMVVSRGRITQVACYLPLTSAEGLPSHWGTRHRAALGLSERCDALVLVVSEERGEVSIADSGELRVLDTPEALAAEMREAFALSRQGQATWKERARLFFTRRWKVKVAVFGVVFGLWLLLAGQQDFEVTVGVPLEIRNIPAGLEIADPVDPRIRVRIRGLRKDASILSEKNVHASVDIAGAGEGSTTLRISRADIVLPNERLYVVDIDPAILELILEEEPSN